MFKVVKNRIVKNWPATISVAQDGGKVEDFSIKLDFKLIDTDQYQTLSSQGDKVLLQKIVVGWDGIGDEKGQPLAFSESMIEQLSIDPSFVSGALEAYFEANSGKASEKNS